MGSQNSSLILQQLRPAPVEHYSVPVQALSLYVSDEETAMRLSGELKKIICPIFTDKCCCIDLPRENGNVRYWRLGLFAESISEWGVFADVYNPDKSFDMIEFVEEHRDEIKVVKMSGVNAYRKQ